MASRTYRFTSPLLTTAAALLLLILALYLFGASPAAHAQFVSAAGTLGGVSGTVTDAGGAPLGGIHVDFYSKYYSSLYPDPQVPWYRDSLRTVTTGPDGRYSTPLEPGIYRVRFSDPTGVFAQQYYRNTRAVAVADDLIVMGSPIDGISAQLEAGGSIRGSIPGERALGGMSVAAYAQVETAWQVVQEVSLADSNSYALSGLPEGVYRVCLVVTLGPRDGPLPCYAARGGGVLSATDVPLAAGAMVQNIDIMFGGFTDPATLRGTVRDKTGAPLEGIEVQAFTSRETVTTTTDISGAYTLSVLAPQEIFVAFTNPRGFYVTQWYSLTESAIAAMPITTQPSQVFAGLDAALELGGRIRGTVTLAGNTAAGAAYGVDAFRAGEYYPFATPYSSRYDPRTGEYVIGGLPPGAYTVCERRWAPWGQPIYSCYPDRVDMTAATPITVAAGSTVPGIDFTVAAPPAPDGYVLTGAVRSAAGGDAAQPLEGMQVSLHVPPFDPDYRPFAPVATTTTGPDGTYRFEGLGGGNYWLRVIDPKGVYAATYYNGSLLPQEATLIFVGTNATPRIYDVNLGRAGSFSGRVTRADGTGLPYAQLNVYQVATTLPFYRALPDDFYADDEGRYQIDGLYAGRYVVCAAASRPPFYGRACHGTQVQYLPDGPSDRYSSFIVEAGRNTGEIDIVLGPTELTPLFLPQVSHGDAPTMARAQTQAMGRIAGVVRSDGGNPLAGIYVDIYQASAPGGWIGPRYMIQTDAAGGYVAEAVEPGRYRVHFYDPRHVYAQQFYSTAVTFDESAAITVNGNAVDGVDAALVAGGGITGSIYGANDPLVALYPVGVFGESEGEWQLVATAENVFDTGPYSVFGLPPGVYRVCRYLRSGPSLATGPCYDRTGGGVAWAADITVTAGATTGGIDLVARGLVDGGSISGTVRGPTGAPLAGVVATLLAQQRSTNWGELRTVTTDAGGGYRFDDLLPNDYAIAFHDPAGAYVTRYYGGIPSLAPLRTVTLGRSEQRGGIDVALTTGGMIGGSFLIDGSLPPPRPHIAAVDIDSRRHFTATYDRLTGEYQVGGLPNGVYVVGASNGIGDLLRSEFDTYYGGSNVASATRLTITGNIRRDGIDMVLLPHGFKGAVAGTVTGDGNRPLGGMRVELFSAHLYYWWEAPPLLYTTTSEDGSYRFTGLRDGEYYVRVVDPADVYSPGYFGGVLFAHQATRVTLADGVGGAYVNMKMVRSGAMRGTVFDQNSDPVPGATVYFFTDEIWITQATTDGDGAYAAGPLPPGQYGVCAYMVRAGVFNNGCYGQKHGDIDSAARAEVRPGATAEGIDIFFDGIPGMTDRLYLPVLGRTGALR